MKFKDLTSAKVSLLSPLFQCNRFNVYLRYTKHHIRWCYNFWIYDYRSSRIISRIINYIYLYFYVFQYSSLSEVPSFLLLSYFFCLENFLQLFLNDKFANNKILLIFNHLSMSWFPFHSWKMLSSDIKYAVDSYFLLVFEKCYATSF